MAENVYSALKDIVGEENLSNNWFELVNNSLDPHPYEYNPKKPLCLTLSSNRTMSRKSARYSSMPTK